MGKRIVTKAGIAGLRERFVKEGVIDIPPVGGITFKHRPGGAKTPPYIEVFIVSESLYKLGTAHNKFVFDTIVATGIPISGVVSKAMVVDSTDSSSSKTRRMGVLAHFQQQ